MSSVAPAEVRSFAFGEPQGELFATATVWEGGSCTSFGSPVRAQGGDRDEEWLLTGEGVALTFSPLGEVAKLELPGAGTTVLHQLARVNGTAVLDGVEVAVDCPGSRSRRLGAPDGKRFESLRTVSAWFGGEDGLVVLSARPRRARGHDSELLAAALIEAGAPVPVAEPRLSSTYTPDGVPARVGLELWLGDEEDADQYARRAAGDSIGRSAACGDPPLRSELLRWRMQGREGVGVYDLLHVR